MKKMKLLTYLTFAMILIACSGGENNSDKDKLSTDLINNPESAVEGATEGEAKLPEFEFREEVVDFGQITQGEQVRKRFRFKNIGNSDLIISNASGSCGCTVPSWPRQPIRPGQEGEIEVLFNSEGKTGRQHKTVTLVANTVPNKKTIAIKGDVLVPDAANTTTEE